MFRKSKLKGYLSATWGYSTTDFFPFNHARAKVIQTKIEDEKNDKEFAGFYSTPTETEITKLYKELVVPKYGQVDFQGDKINIRPSVLARIVAELHDYSFIGNWSDSKWCCL